MKILFSPSTLAFYAAKWEHIYISARNWPEDLLEIDENTYIKFSQQPPKGKILGEDNSLPAWVDLQIKSKNEVKEDNVAIKKALLFEASSKISIWQVRLLMGRISDDDKAKLNAWLDYIDNLELLNINKAEDIIWPTPPEA